MTISGPASSSVVPDSSASTAGASPAGTSSSGISGCSLEELINSTSFAKTLSGFSHHSRDHILTTFQPKPLSIDIWETSLEVVVPDEAYTGPSSKIPRQYVTSCSGDTTPISILNPDFPTPLSVAYPIAANLAQISSAIPVNAAFLSIRGVPELSDELPVDTMS